MKRIKIIGAGSIGNHLAHGCRQQNWSVTLCDRDQTALDRTQADIYPNRYGSWDPALRLAISDTVAEDTFDAVIIGTPPDTHLALALEQLRRAPPRVLLIEKPLCTPDLSSIDGLRKAAAEAGTRLLVAYNHRLTQHTQLARSWLANNPLGELTTLRVLFREHWGGIFAAHPWLRGPEDTYLGFTERGGGSLGEHSHGINIWQYFAQLTGRGRIREVVAMLDEVEHDGARFDRIAQLSVRSEAGLVGTIVQDVVTQPAQKWLRMEGQNGFMEWQVNREPGIDSFHWELHGGLSATEPVRKTRPDDFRGEIEHLGELIDAPDQASPLDFEHGVNTMRVIAAAIESSRSGRRVTIDYDQPLPTLPC